MRELLRLGLDAVNPTGNDTTNDAHELRLQRIEETLATIQSAHGQQLDSIVRHLRGLPQAPPGAAGASNPESA